jgi:Ni,Fe-hydrogenase I cytochrome b subunit
MKKYILIVLLLLWLANLAILIIALTDFFPGNPFHQYRFFIGVVFLCVSGFLRDTILSYNMSGMQKICFSNSKN